MNCWPSCRWGAANLRVRARSLHSWTSLPTKLKTPPIEPMWRRDAVEKRGKQKTTKSTFRCATKEAAHNSPHTNCAELCPTMLVQCHSHTQRQSLEQETWSDRGISLHYFSMHKNLGLFLQESVVPCGVLVRVTSQSCFKSAVWFECFIERWMQGTNN